MISLYFNEKKIILKKGIFLNDFLEQYQISETTTGIAIAINNCVIPRSDWNTCLLKEADRIVMIHAVQGG